MKKSNCDQLCELASKIYRSKSHKELEKHWRKFFTLSFQQWGFNQKAINALWYWGNWDHNWDILNKMNSKYKSYNAESFLRKFKGDVSYICDRVTIDRVFRCHWLWNQYLLIVWPISKRPL